MNINLSYNNYNKMEQSTISNPEPMQQIDNNDLLLIEQFRQCNISAMVNPSQYIGLMKYYIYKKVLSCVPIQLTINYDSLYGEIKYSSLRTSKLNCLFINALENIDISEIPRDNIINGSIMSWYENTKYLTSYSELDAISDDKTISISYPDDSSDINTTLIEYFIGTLLNKLRRKTFNFVYVLGMFLTTSDPVESDINRFFSNTDKVIHIVYENIVGITLEEWLKNKPTLSVFYNIILQVALALTKAQEKIGFVHNALYAKNIILKYKPGTVSTFHIKSKIYTIKSDYIAIITNLSTARVTNNGFGICYKYNPSIFTPGKDICNLIISSLILLNTSNLYKDVEWLNTFFSNYFETAEGAYDDLFEKYEGFVLPDDHPQYSMNPLDFLNWFHKENGKILNDIVVTSPRFLKPLINEKGLSDDIKEDLSMIPSGIIKQYIMTRYGIDYKQSEQEKEYDILSINEYNKYMMETVQSYIVYYNFPINKQYSNIDPINYYKVVSDLIYRYKVLSNYIMLYRYAVTIKYDAIPKFNADVFSLRNSLKYNIEAINNIPLYRLYQLTFVMNNIENTSITGDIIEYYKDMYPSTNWIKNIYPECAEYIDLYIIPVATRLLKPFTLDKYNNYYYPPHTLQQFKQLFKQDRRVVEKLKTLIKKLVCGYNKDLERHVFNNSGLRLFNEADDVRILLYLKSFYERVNPVQFNRGLARVKDIVSLIGPLGIDPKSYLDYGGGDGSISSAVATKFGINKDSSYSLDIEEWFGRLQLPKYDNIKYLRIKEGQAIPLPDNSIDIVTCFQVLHHIKNIDFVLSELRRVCKYMLIIREHDCQNNDQRMIIDLEHSIYEISVENTPNVKFLNDYKAWYRSKQEWGELISKYGFKHVVSLMKGGTTFYYYDVFRTV
jgi:ubiquinone/menaquinone biosynthesis C-methylase UbiE